MDWRKQLFYKLLPYLISFLSGIIIYWISGYIDGSLKDLLINISASLLAITVILIFYELIKSISDRKLNQEIFEYGKMQIDREVLGIVNQLMKFFYPLEKLDFSQKSVANLLHKNLVDINEMIEANTFFGFQIFRTWEVYETNLESILENPLITEKFENDQIIAVIQMLKALRDVSDVKNMEQMLLPVEKNNFQNNYKLVKGSEINPENTKYPNRFLLLKNVGNNKFQVLDFPDIPNYHEDKAFRMYKFNPNLCSHLGVPMYQLIRSVNKWLSLTGKEFLIDTKMFKMKTVTKGSA